MLKRRIIYLLCLLGSVLFYFLYQQWFSFVLLILVITFPWLSLALSYPAMRAAAVEIRCPGITRLGVPSRSAMQVTCPYPTPPVECKLRLLNNLSGDRYLGVPGELIPTEHCGRITVTVPRCVVYDYLGLFAKKLPEQAARTVYVLPKPVAGELPQTGIRNDSALRPKPGGGLSEHYELRLYRPGDELRSIHWKLSAKTGSLIYREAMVQAKQGYVLNMTLSGTPEQLDKKLGELLWTSRILLREKCPHQLRCLTGKGTVSFSVGSENELEQVLCELISMPCATGENIPETTDAFWQQNIGGETCAQ